MLKRTAVTATLLAAVMLVAGCGRSRESAPPPAAPTPPSTVSASDLANAAPVAPPPPTPEPPTPASPADSAAPAEPSAAASATEEQIVEQYKEALSQYYLANASSPTRHIAPKTLQELVTKGILKKLPAAPPGKKIVYRPESWEVVIENAK